MSGKKLPGVTVESFPFDENSRILEFPADAPVFKTKRKPARQDRLPAPRIRGRNHWLIVNGQFQPVTFTGSVWRPVMKRQYLHQRFPGLDGGGD